MSVLAELDLGSAAVILRRARVTDVTDIVGLLADDPLGAGRDGVRRRGCTLVQLTSDKSRADAHRFYEKLGFAATHEGMKLTL